MVDRRQQLALQIAEGVLMRVPAAQVDLHHPHAGLDQPPRDEKPLAPFLAAVQVAGAVGFLRQIERIVLARAASPAANRSACCAMSVPGGRAGRRGRRGRARAAGRRAAAAARCGSRAAAIETPSACAEVGQVEVGVAATACCPTRPSAQVRRARSGSIRIVVAEAVRARAGGVLGVALRRQVDAPAGRTAGRAGPDSRPGYFIRLRARQSRSTAGKPDARRRRRGVGDHRADRRPARCGPDAGWTIEALVSPTGSSVVPVCSR